MNLTRENIEAWQAEYGVYTLVPPPAPDELVENADGTYTLIPERLHAFAGELDGCYICGSADVIQATGPLRQGSHDACFEGRGPLDMPDWCKAVPGVRYDVHQHAEGVLDVLTGLMVQEHGEPYCVAIRANVSE